MYFHAIGIAMPFGFFVPSVDHLPACIGLFGSFTKKQMWNQSQLVGGGWKWHCFRANNRVVEESILFSLHKQKIDGISKACKHLFSCWLIWLGRKYVKLIVKEFEYEKFFDNRRNPLLIVWIVRCSTTRCMHNTHTAPYFPKIKRSPCKWFSFSQFPLV